MGKRLVRAPKTYIRDSGVLHALLEVETPHGLLGHPVEYAIEIKRTTAPDVSKGFRLACGVLKPRAAFVVYGGDDEWPMGSNVRAISLRGIAARLARTR